MAASALSSENTVKKIYQTVIDEVLTNVREAFLDEGHDEQLLQELKQMWEAKLNASRAVQVSDEASSNAASSSNTNASSSLRLPISRETNHNMPAHLLANTPQTSSNLDIKPQLVDPTRAALQALPHSLYNKNNNGNSSQQQQDLKNPLAAQIDGGVDGSSSEDDEDDDIIGAESNHGDDDNDGDDDKTNNDDQSEHGKEDPEPLNSEDDLTDPGTDSSNSDLFDTENVIVCQYDKITRIKNKWKFHLKDGIMNINGRDYLFSKANGDAEW